MILSLILLILFLLSLDFYGYYGLKKLTRYQPFANYKKWIIRIYWIMDVSFLAFAVIWTLIIRNSSWEDYVQYRSYFYITGAFILIFLPKIVYLIFNLLHDMVLIIKWLFKKVFSGAFINRTLRRPPDLLLAGFILSLFMFVWVAYGILYGRFNFQVKEVELQVADLPESFDGFRIIQFSDTHLGSFARTRPVLRGIKKIARTPHDLLVFTGDMVNNEAVEAEKYIEAFAGVDSPYGKFSILGNHDLGDYRRWYTLEEKAANLDQLQEYQAQMGFEMLRNEHRFVRKGNDSIMIIGVDNWGVPPFAQLGDLKQAMGENAHFPFQILLSHDPSHWTEEVLPQTDIFLTLSGHTHGMQAGIRTAWFRFSPVALKYKHWYGLYSNNDQLLYVNRGFGFIGFPGRMGMRPEITLFTLRRK